MAGVTPEALARKWCPRKKHGPILWPPQEKCQCTRIAGAVREALEEQQSEVRAIEDALHQLPHQSHNGPIAHGWTTPVEDGCILCDVAARITALREGREHGQG